MIDVNGKLNSISLDEARTIVLENARLAGVEVPVGSVEYILSEWLAKVFLDVDTAVFLSIQKFLYPTGQDIDIQNPGIPRKQPSKANGYLELDNSLGTSDFDLPIASVLSASNGLTYSNVSEGVTVLAGEIGYVYVESVETGSKNNLPSLQVFAGDIPITNPQPLIGGMDLETDTEYFNRIVFLKTNFVSEQTSISITKNLLNCYLDARVYVNNSSNGLEQPVTIPASGYNCVVILPSGVNAPARELQKAIETLVALAEFVGVNNVSTEFHPVVYGISYSGLFPIAYSITPAQAVKTVIELEVVVKFDTNIIEVEKYTLAERFANNFINRLMSTFYSTDGSYNFTFEPSGNPSISNSVLATGIVKSQNNIAPFVSIEAIRSIIYDQTDSNSIKGLQYRECSNLTCEFDSLIVGQDKVTLSIHSPFEGSVNNVDFAKDSLFSDLTSWYDRYIVLDPSLISVKVIEE